MIIGKGMVAGALKNLSGWDNDILFSSGVSNSGELDEKKYQREIDLVKTNLEKLIPSATFVYFSTISIFDLLKKENPYILHKLKIESIIKSSDVNHMILRLPNLVGFSSNPNTLTNYFADSIRINRTISLNRIAIRHLIDITDLSSIIKDIKNNFDKSRMTVNVETDRPLTAYQILTLIEEVMQKKANIHPADVVSNLVVKQDNSDISSINYIWKTAESYHKNLLRKYYSN